LGFYRVAASLTDKTVISAYGSKPAGWITYAIVPDPDTRNFSPTEKVCRFGMQGGFNAATNLQPWLGIHWEPNAANWAYVQPTQSTVPKDPGPLPSITYGDKPWTIYPLFGMTANGITSIPSWAANADATVNSAHMSDWTGYCKDVARWAVSDYPDLAVRYYQPSWELSNSIGDPSGATLSSFSAHLVPMFAACYPAVHEVDIKAFIIGHAPYSAYHGQQAEFTQLIKDGILPYLDGAADHAYFATANTKSGPEFPEFNSYNINLTSGDLAQSLKAIKTMFGGKPLFITEQGYTSAQTAPSELTQAMVDTRQSLIDAGEGTQFTIAFYAVDYYASGLAQFGYYYNLSSQSVSGISFSPAVVAPKPAAAAYAAMTWLLEGATSKGRLNTPGDQNWGYQFTRDSKTIYALWTAKPGAQTITIPVPAASAIEYDWMGNAKKVKPSNHSVLVELTGEPTYIVFDKPGLTQNEHR
jgi:hypothetical protein